MANENIFILLSSQQITKENKKYTHTHTHNHFTHTYIYILLWKTKEKLNLCPKTLYESYIIIKYEEIINKIKLKTLL